MTQVRTCPDERQLQTILQGRAAPEELEAFAAHLEQCQSCAQRLEQSLAGDTLLEAMQAQSTAHDHPSDPAVPPLIERLLQLRAMSQPLPTTPPDATEAFGSRTPVAEETETCDFLAPPQAPDEIGRLGTYRVLKVLGSGGMGLVFRAEDVHLKRQVALKVLKPEAAKKPRAKERFLREAQAAAAVEHEHIVTIHQVGEDRGVPFLAMQWLKGESLEDRLKQGGVLQPAQVVRVGRQIALGLAAAHEQGLIHRDIKPANLWLEPSRGGHVKILDFGLARVLADDVHLTQSGTIVGTPAYMAPEQARGDKTDHRCDLFSLGVVLYRMATGRLPFRGDNTMAVLTSLAMDQPEPPRSAELPAELSELIMQLLAKNPAQRPASARMVADRLQRIGQQLGAPRVEPDQTGELPATADPAPTLAGDEPAAQPATIAQSSRKAARRRPVAIAATLGALALLVAGAVFFLQTPSGTLIVEMKDDEVEARIKGGKLILSGPDGEVRYTLTPSERNKKLAAGPYTIRVEGADGLVLDTPEFQLKKGGVVTVRVTLEPKVAAKKDPPAIDPDRKAAEYVLSIGGTVHVNEEGRDRKVVADLPREAFRLTYVWLRGNQQVSDAGLTVFKGCKNLTYLDFLSNTKVSDAGLAHFEDCKNLTYLALGGTKTTDAGLAHFQDCKNLTYLNLQFTRVGDAGLAYFKDCKNLTSLVLDSTQVSDAGLAHFKDCKNLLVLELLGTQVGDAGLAYLKDCKNLTQLNLFGTKVSDAGLAYLKDCKNLTQLSLYGTKVSDAGLAHFKDCKNLTQLILGLTQVSDAWLAHLKDCKNLIYLDLTRTQVGDTGLANLKNCKNLTVLQLNSTKVSDAGLAYFKDCKNLTALSLAYTQVSDAGLAHFKEGKNLTSLWLHETQVSDVGLGHLKDCKNLTNLTLQKTKVTAAGIAELKKALPQCKIEWDGGVLEPR